MTELWQSSAWYDGSEPKQLTSGMGKEQSLEQLMSREPDPVEAAERAFSRLQGLQEFVFRVDVGDYPIQWFSSGEKRKKQRIQNGTKVEIEEPVGLPIQPKGVEKGLRYAACHVIFDEREFLKSEGCGDIADRIIATGSLRDAGTYIGNKKP